MLEISNSSKVKINSIGFYIAENKESNLENLEKFGVSQDFLENKLGVIERSVKKKDETTSDLCVKAFQSLLKSTEIALDKIRLLCVVTQNPDYKIPYTAAILHHKLQLSKDCMTFDVSQGCAGYTHAMALLDALMKSKKLDDALLFTCDPYSSIVNCDDKNTSMLFGDAASVSYLTRMGIGYTLVDSNFGTSPSSYSHLICKDFLEMDGRGIFTNVVQELPGSIQYLLRANSLSIDEIDLFLLHQASKYLVEYIQELLKIPKHKLPFDIMNYGNTVSSSIPILLSQYLTQKKHEKIVLSGFGVGFSWGNCLIELSE